MSLCAQQRRRHGSGGRVPCPFALAFGCTVTPIELDTNHAVFIAVLTRSLPWSGPPPAPRLRAWCVDAFQRRTGREPALLVQPSCVLVRALHNRVYRGSQHRRIHSGKVPSGVCRLEPLKQGKVVGGAC